DAPWGLLISKLQQIGLTPSDIHHLEYLDNKSVLEKLPGGFRWLQRNVREDVIVYFETYAQLLEEQLVETLEVDISDMLLVKEDKKEIVSIEAI
ncbi:MAG: hypothetical protein ACO3BD_07020, partial [Chitinophagaceae bacterium]